MVPKQSLHSFIIIISLLLILCLSIALFFISLNKNSKIASEIASKFDAINKFADKSKIPVTDESITFLTEERNKLKEIYNRFKIALTSPLSETAAKEKLDSLQFKEKLIQMQKRLYENAKSHNLLLPKSLGFAEYETELPKPSEIPNLIRRLRVLEELINTMTLSGIDFFYEINFTGIDIQKSKEAKIQSQREEIEKKPQPDVAEETPIYYDVSVSFKIGCTSAELIDFLYKLRLSPFVFIVDDLDVEKAKTAVSETVNENLNASLSIRAVMLN